MMEVIKSIDEEKVIEISKIKNEPKWMTDFRVNSYKKFIELKNPKFGPALNINFDIINYYKKITDNVTDDWSSRGCEITAFHVSLGD